MRDFSDQHAREIAAHFGDALRGGCGAQTRTVFLCFTNRCGSNLVAHALASTGKLPCAPEMFNSDFVCNTSRERGFRSFPEFASRAAAENAVDGQFAVKASGAQLAFLSRCGILGEALVPTVFVWVRRRDILAQAISWAIARQTQQWVSQNSPLREPKYDRNLIDESLWWVCHGNAAIEYFFAHHAIKPVEIWYEDFVQDMDSHASRVLDAAGIERANMRPDLIPIKKQSSAMNSEFRRRFLAGE